MAKKANKELAVDGTAKLAAKAKPGDKHDKTNVTIEEAVVASPRHPRKRTGDFNDFEPETAVDASSKEADATATKPRKKAKTSATATATADKTAKKTKKDESKAANKSGGGPSSSSKKAKNEAKPKDADTAQVDGPAIKKAAKKGPKPEKNGDATATKAAAPAEVNGAVVEKPTKAPTAGATARKGKTEEKKAPDGKDGKEAASKAKKPKKPSSDNADAKQKTQSEKPVKAEGSAKGKAKKEKTDPKEKTAKTSKASTKPKAAKPIAHKDAAKKSAPSSESTKDGAAKSRKRKASATADSESVKKDVLDPLAEHAAATKKRKTSDRKSLGESFGELVNTGIEAAAQGANSLRQSIGGSNENAKENLTDKAPEVASHLSKAQSTLKGVLQKGKGKATLADSASLDVDSDSGSDSVLDDHTAELLQGLESPSDDEPAGDLSDKGQFSKGQAIPALPNMKATKKQLKAIKSSGETGTVYLGRVPHGFYEHEIRGYFSQFGDISRLRLSRSRKTGKSKHYAFIEFENVEVARIAAGTMDNYLMFGHILKCKFVPKENLHEEIWKGANKRFKGVPWNKIEGRKLEKPKSKSAWTKKIDGEQQKREKKARDLAEIGYDLSLPRLKGVDEVQKIEAAPETVVEKDVSLITTGKGTSQLVVSEEKKSTKGKGSKDAIKTTAGRSKRASSGGAAKSKNPA